MEGARILGPVLAGIEADMACQESRRTRQKTSTAPRLGSCGRPNLRQLRAPSGLSGSGSSGSWLAMQCAANSPHHGTSSPGYQRSRLPAQSMMTGLSALPGASRVPMAAESRDGTSDFPSQDLRVQMSRH
jgi:hypothetical protein